MAIATSTFLISMLNELASNQWVVTKTSIAKRVGRYETKAKLKKNKDFTKPMVYSVGLSQSLK